MTIKKIAKAFGISVTELAEYIGYTRQTLYVATEINLNKLRAKSAIRALCSLNQKQFDEEMQKAEYRFNERKEAIAAFEKMLLGHDAGEVEGGGEAAEGVMA